MNKQKLREKKDHKQTIIFSSIKKRVKTKRDEKQADLMNILRKITCNDDDNDVDDDDDDFVSHIVGCM